MGTAASQESGSPTLSVDTSTRQKELENKQNLDLASPTATAWTEKLNNIMFKPTKSKQNSSRDNSRKVASANEELTNEEDAIEYKLPHDLGKLKPALRKWYKDNEIYSPVRPKTSNYLTKEKETKYMQIAPELLLPDNYEGEEVYGEEADAMYNEFKEQQRILEELAKEKERKEREDLEKQGEMDGGDKEGDIATYIDEHRCERELLSARSDEMAADDKNGIYALSELDELKLKGVDVDAHLEGLMSNLLSGGGGRNTNSAFGRRPERRK